MSIEVIRHSVSEANDKGLPAYGSPDAPLLPLGVDQAIDLGMGLIDDYGMEVLDETVAVSELLRSQQTAAEAGFIHIGIFSVLNEVEQVTFEEVRMVKDGKAPRVAIEAAECLLEDPPGPRLWVSHGMVIAGLTQIMGMSGEFERLLPRFAERRVFDI